MKIAIMSDSAAGFTKTELERYSDIIIVPLVIIENGIIVYEDNQVAITRDQLYQKMINDKYEIKTSQTNREDLRKIWLKTLETAEQILFLPIAKAASGQFQLAESLANSAEFFGKVHVFDTGAADIPLKFMVFIAYKLASENKVITEIVAILKKLKQNYECYITPYTLKYLTKGGRAPAAIVSLSSFLRIKAIIKCKETIEKAAIKMTHNGAITDMLKRIIYNAKEHQIDIIKYPIYIIDGLCSQKLLDEAENKARSYGFTKIKSSYLCNILNAHTFKETIGFAVFPNDIIKELPEIE